MAKTASSDGTSADRIKTDTAFERTWENKAVFSRAGKAAKILRTIFRDVTRPRISKRKSTLIEGNNC